MPRVAIAQEHEEFADLAAEILLRSGFKKVDREVNVTIGGTAEETFNLDVCAVYLDALLVVEIKSENEVDFKNEIIGWAHKKARLAEYQNIRVIGSRRQRVRTEDLRAVRKVAIVFLPTRDSPGPTHQKQANAAGIELWHRNVLRYYDVTSKALGEWTKFEIMHDVSLRPSETENLLQVPAIKGEQPGGDYYLCKMKPADLLRVAFVHRRSKRTPNAYQRIVKKGRIDSMNAFLRKHSASLSNNIILAVDPELKRDVSFRDGMLTLPGRYCSSWVVDGQHRLYGFVKTKFGKGETPRKFELPVVVVNDLNPVQQAALFVEINSNQRKIDPTLLADLSTVLKDLSKKETWPSMIAKRMSEVGPFRGLVDLDELSFDSDAKPITLAGLSKYALTRFLLAPRMRKGAIFEYRGPLFQYARFDWHRSANNRSNKQALERQVGVLNTFFGLVRGILGRKWTNVRRYGATTYTGANALLLVLNRVLESGRSFNDLRIGEFLQPLARARISWTRRGVVRYANWQGFIDLANIMIRALNEENDIQLPLYEPIRRRA